MPKSLQSLSVEELDAKAEKLIGQQQQLSAERDKALRPIRAKARKVQAELDAIASARTVAGLPEAEREALKAALGVSG